MDIPGGRRARPRAGRIEGYHGRPMKVERPDAMASPLPGSLSGLSGGGAAPAGDEQEALALDRADPLATHRRRFHLPMGPGGAAAIYFCGHSLGLQPVDTRAAVLGELDDWAALGVRAHFEGHHPWYSYHERFRDCGARLVGAEPGEVVMMNSLTVNLHLMLATFYRPAGDRYQILIEDGAFPSDAYAVTSQIAHRGYDPRDALRIVAPRPGEHLLDVDDIEAMLDADGRRDRPRSPPRRPLLHRTVSRHRPDRRGGTPPRLRRSASTSRTPPGTCR